jgi:uncharacterized protein YndB with AHSA1/START domain
MTTTERVMQVPREAVWETLARAGDYAEWVVGSAGVRAADPTWPEPGSRFHHSVGIGPLALRDHTEALESRPQELLKLRARARPLATAIVTLELQALDGGTRVLMTEELEGPPRLVMANALGEWLTKARNGKSLERLERLAARNA